MSFFKKFGISNEKILIVIGAIVLIYFLMNYSYDKNSVMDSMSNNSEENVEVQPNIMLYLTIPPVVSMLLLVHHRTIMDYLHLVRELL